MFDLFESNRILTFIFNQIVTSTPKTGKHNLHQTEHTIVDMGRIKTHDPIQKHRPSKRVVSAASSTKSPN